MRNCLRMLGLVSFALLLVVGCGKEESVQSPRGKVLDTHAVFLPLNGAKGVLPNMNQNCIQHVKLNDGSEVLEFNGSACPAKRTDLLPKEAIGFVLKAKFENADKTLGRLILGEDTVGLFEFNNDFKLPVVVAPKKAAAPVAPAPKKVEKLQAFQIIQLCQLGDQDEKNLDATTACTVQMNEKGSFKNLLVNLRDQIRNVEKKNEKKNEKKQVEIDALKKQNQELEANAAKTQGDLNKAIDAKKQLDVKIAGIEKQITTLNSSVSDRDKKLTVLNAELDAAKKAQTQATKEITDLKKEIETLKKKLEEKKE